MESLSLSSLSPYYHFIFTALPFIISGIIVLVSRKSNPTKLRLPPGPPGWPVVGNLFQVAGSGKPFFQYVADQIPKYGPIFMLKMGTRTMIVVSSADLAREAFIQKGQIFASRPRETPTRTIFSCNKFTVNAALYGPVWRSLRRNMVQGALNSTRLKEFRDARESAMDRLVGRLRSEADANGGVVKVLKNARFAVFCILATMTFGLQMDEETIEKVDEMMKTVLMTVDARLDDYLPILSPFFGKQRKRAMEVRRKQIETLTPIIERRRRALQNPGSDPSAVPFSYLDTLFDLEIDGRKSSPTNSEIVTLCSELMNGGTDTTATAVEWAIARMVHNPEFQNRIYDEIRETVGDRRVEQKDAEKMIYLNAFVKELLRKHPPTYFTLTHAVTEPATLAGYDIPMDTNVEFFVPGINSDPKLWVNPERFDPDRFLIGGEDADITGVKEVRMIPFGVGRRICPGLGMATIHVNLIIARMVQEFEWSVDPENPKVDFTGKTEFTVVMKNTLKAYIKPRV